MRTGRKYRFGVRGLLPAATTGQPALVPETMLSLLKPESRFGRSIPLPPPITTPS